MSDAPPCDNLTKAAASRPATDLAIYRRLLRYVTPYRAAFILSLFGMVLFALTDTGFAALMKPMLDGSFVDKDPDTIRWLPVFLVGLFLLRGIAGFFSTYCMAWVGRNVVRDLREAMFCHFLWLPVAFYEGISSSQLLSKMTYDAEQVAQASTEAITVLVRDSLTIIGLLAWMIYISWKLALLIFIITPVVALLMRYVNRRYRKSSQSIQDLMAQLTHRTSEAIDGQRIIKLNGAHTFEKQRFSLVNNRYRAQQMKIVATMAASAPTLQLVLAIVLALIVTLATSDTLAGQVSVGGFMSFMVAMMMMMAPIKRLTTVNAVLQKGIVAAKSIFAILDTPTEVNQGTALKKCQGNVTYNHVSFQYDSAEGPALQRINLTINAGESVAFVGRSGGGKSTLVSLLPRFYPPSDGVISIDGTDIQTLSLIHLRSQISLVSQDIRLFNASIRDNICYGAAHVSEEDLMAAAKAAHAWEFIDKLPEKMDTMTGDDGVLLSGGQRQRLAIARAFLKDAPILILDEATSALDSESEKFIQDSLSRLMKQRTTLVIAHRLSTIENVDRIFVLEGGKIIESGSHQQLLSKKGHYARLHALQHSTATATPTA